MILSLDFAEARVNRRGGKKNHGNHSNNNTDRASRSVIRLMLTQWQHTKDESII